MMEQDQRDNLIDFIEAQQGRTLLWAVVSMCVGIFWYFSQFNEPNHSIIYGLFFLTCVGAFLSRKIPIYKTIALFMCMAVLGAGLSAWRTHRLDTKLLFKDARAQIVEGTVIEYEPVAKGWRVMLSDLSLEKVSFDKTPDKVRVTIRKKDYQPQIGQRISAYSKLLAPSPPLVPGAYDFQRHAFFQGIGAYGYSIGDVTVLKEGGGEGSIINGLRQAISKTILKSQNQPESGVMVALLTGQRKTINKKVQENLRHSGLAHLLAISGLHVGLTAGIVFYFVRLLLVICTKPQHNLPIKKISAGVALLASIGYMFMVGAPVTTQRAVVMTGLVLIAVMTDRRALTLRLVALAAFIILVIQPESFIKPGFQMSFSAVIGLVSFYRFSEPLWYKMRYGAGWFRKSLIYLAGVTSTTVIATLSTAPFALYHFQQISVFGFIANILAMPIMGFVVMPAGVLSYLLIPLGLSDLSLTVMGWGIYAISEIAKWVATMDGAVLQFPVMQTWVLIILSIGFMSICFLKGKWRGVGFIPLSIGFYLAITPPTPIAFVSGNAKVIGFVPQDDSGFVYLANKSDGFLTKLSKQLVGRGGIALWEGENSEQFQCDDWACIANIQNKTITFLKHPAVISRECYTADIVIANFPIPRWCKATVIDKFDLWRNGGYIIYPKGKDDLKISYVAQKRGNRPWVKKSKPRKKKPDIKELNPNKINTDE